MTQFEMRMPVRLVATETAAPFAALLPFWTVSPISLMPLWPMVRQPTRPPPSMAVASGPLTLRSVRPVCVMLTVVATTNTPLLTKITSLFVATVTTAVRLVAAFAQFVYGTTFKPLLAT